MAERAAIALGSNRGPRAAQLARPPPANATQP